MSATIPTPFNLGRTESSSDPLFNAQDESDGGSLDDTGGNTSTGNLKAGAGLPSDKHGVNFTVLSGKAGVRYYFNSTPSSLDFTTTGEKRIFMYGAQANSLNRRQLSTVSDGGHSLKMYSGSGQSPEIREWVLGGSDTALALRSGIFLFAIDPEAVGTVSDIGSFDASDVLSYGHFNTKGDMVGSTSCWWFWCAAVLVSSEKTSIDIPRIYGLSSSWQDLVDAVQGTTGFTGQNHLYVERSGDVITLFCPCSIGNSSQVGATATSFNDGGLTVVSPASASSSDPRFHLTNESMRVYLDLNTSDTAIFSGTYTWGTQAAFDFSQSNAAQITLSNPTFTGMGEFTCGSSVTGSATFNLGGSSKVIIGGANLNGSTINGSADIVGGNVATFTNINVTGILDFDTAGTYTLDGCTIGEVSNSSGGNITLKLVNGASVTTNTESNIVINRLVDISAPNIVDGSRVQLYNITMDSEISVGVVGGGTGFLETVDLLSSEISDGDDIALRCSLYDNTNGNVYNDLEILGSVSVFGFSSTLSQSLNGIISSIHGKGVGFRGANVSGFQLDVRNIEIDSDVTHIDGQKLATWFAYNIASTNAGIRNYFDSVGSINENNFFFKKEIQVDNTGDPAVWTGASWVRSDGVTIVAPTSNTIQFSNALSYVPTVGNKDSEIDAIKAKTDLFTFAGNDVKATLDGEQVVASNMRGTDGANTMAPDNAGITQIQTDISNLNDITVSDVYTEFTTGSNEDVFKANVSGLATESNATANKNSIIAGLDANEAKIDLIETKVDNLNDLSVSEIDAILANYGIPKLSEMTAAFAEIKGDGWTVSDTLNSIKDELSSVGTSPSEIYSYFTDGSNEDVFKADVGGLASQTDVTEAKDEIISDHRLFQEADEFKTPEKFIKREKGTNTVLVEKNYLTDGAGTESLTDV